MLCLAHQGALEQYWVERGKLVLIDDIYLPASVKAEIEPLITEGGLTGWIDRHLNFGAIARLSYTYPLLLFCGYLNPEPIDPTGDVYRLSIPNQEIRSIFETWLQALPAAP